jgi:threonine dehydratase
MAAARAIIPAMSGSANASLPTLEEITAMQAVVDAVVPPTPSLSWPLLNERLGATVWIKHDNHTAIGSFKIRGAVAYMDRLVGREPKVRGVIAATRGNFGQAVAFAARRHGLKAVIVIPHGNSIEKNLAMKALGAELIEHGTDFQAALDYSRELADQIGFHWISSYNRDLVLGSAVSAFEFLSERTELERVYVPIGMGTGICGMIAARDALRHKAAVIGVAAEGAPAIALSFEARKVVPHACSTRIADGLACSTPVTEALENILRGAERIVRVSDAEIEAAQREYFKDTHNVSEGAAGAGLAALFKERPSLAGRTVGTVFTGGNIDASTFLRVLSAA